MGFQELEKKVTEFKNDINSYLLERMKESSEEDFLPKLKESIGNVPCSLIHFANELTLLACGNTTEDDWELMRFQFDHKNIHCDLIVKKIQKENTNNESELQSA